MLGDAHPDTARSLQAQRKILRLPEWPRPVGVLPRAPAERLDPELHPVELPRLPSTDKFRRPSDRTRKPALARAVAPPRARHPEAICGCLGRRPADIVRTRYRGGTTETTEYGQNPPAIRSNAEAGAGGSGGFASGATPKTRSARTATGNWSAQPAPAPTEATRAQRPVPADGAANRVASRRALAGT